MTFTIMTDNNHNDNTMPYIDMLYYDTYAVWKMTYDICHTALFI